MLNLKERTLIDLGTIDYDPAGLLKVTTRGQVAVMIDSKGKIDYNSPLVRGLDAACPRLDTSPDSKLDFSLVGGVSEITDYQVTALLGSSEAFDEFGLDKSLRLTSSSRNKEWRDQNYTFCSSKIGQYVTDLAITTFDGIVGGSPWEDCKLTNTFHSTGKGKARKKVFSAKFTPTQAWVEYTESGLPIIQIDLGKNKSS